MSRKPTHVQSLIFSREEFTGSMARAWAKRHGFIAPYLDMKVNSIRIRQVEPSEFVPKSFRTIHLKDGVEAVIGHLRHEPE